MCAESTLHHWILFVLRDYGFSGANKDVILHSVKLLGKDLVSWNSESHVITPVHSLSGFLELSYYSNQVRTDQAAK